MQDTQPNQLQGPKIDNETKIRIRELCSQADADAEETINAVSNALSYLPTIAATLHVQAMKNKDQKQALTLFDSLSVAPITIEAYLDRFINYLLLEEVDLIALLIYIDRYFSLKPNSFLSPHNIHRVVGSFSVLIQRTLNDPYYHWKYDYYAKVAGMPCNQLRDLEMEILSGLHFDLQIAPECYQKYKDDLIKNSADLIAISRSTAALSTVPPLLITQSKPASLCTPTQTSENKPNVVVTSDDDEKSDNDSSSQEASTTNTQNYSKFFQAPRKDKRNDDTLDDQFIFQMDDV